MCAWVHMGVGILLAVKFRHEWRTSVKGQRKSLRQKQGEQEGNAGDASWLVGCTLGLH